MFERYIRVIANPLLQDFELVLNRQYLESLGVRAVVRRHKNQRRIVSTRVPGSDGIWELRFPNLVKAKGNPRRSELHLERPKLSARFTINTVFCVNMYLSIFLQYTS
ncbi:hypothetical protein TGARI_370470 [Toxoplasma gondii ARI]|uniref:Uncharacterized protein n=1 Tax=Toxoplasma gondii ARI TaxID=1074872 RepID=A0A139XVA8_TOXGO|nr:hypothetical protein TGARI_370470 [Toxoplasma gondii ARI]